MFFIIIFSVFFIVFFAGPFVYDKMMTPKLKQRRAQAEAEFAAARPAALPSPDAPLSPHLDLGSWGEWDKAIRSYRATKSFRAKLVLAFLLPVAAWMCLVPVVTELQGESISELLFIPFVVILLVFPLQLWSSCQPLRHQDEHFEAVVGSEGLNCPKCNSRLKEISETDAWCCAQCDSKYTATELKNLIDASLKKQLNRISPISKVVSFSDRPNGSHNVIDRIFLALRVFQVSLILVLILTAGHLLLIGWMMSSFDLERWATVLAFCVGILLMGFSIRLHREPYSRCAHCLHRVPEEDPLPGRCSECGHSWHAPGGLLHHRITLRPLAYGGLTVFLLGFLLLGNGIYRDWQLNQALQTPTTATASALIAGLGQDNGYWGDDVKAVQAELHQRNLTTLEAQSLVGVYVACIERDNSPGQLGWSLMISMMDTGELDADTSLRISQVLTRFSFGDEYLHLRDEKCKAPPLTSQLAMELLDAKAALGGSAQDPIFAIGRFSNGDVYVLPELSSGNVRLDIWLDSYIEAADLQVGKESVYLQIDLDSLNPALAEVTP